ncbi:MAG: hypothetical protein NVV62_02915 [Terricaulis sp.]|nr:hypothetical protein [Terricaulis sp.]
MHLRFAIQMQARHTKPCDAHVRNLQPGIGHIGQHHSLSFKVAAQTQRGDHPALHEIER